MPADIKETKKKWYIKNKDRILKKARENYKKKVGIEPMRQRSKKIILTFD